MPSLRDSKYEPSSIPGLKPRAIKCRRSATKIRKTYVYASLEFLKQVPLGASHGCAGGTEAGTKTAYECPYRTETFHGVAPHWPLSRLRLFDFRFGDEHGQRLERKRVTARFGQHRAVRLRINIFG